MCVLFVSLRDLVWRRRRFAVALVGTSLVLGLSLTLAGVSASFDNEAQRTVAAMRAKAFVVPAGVSGPFMSSATLPAQTADALGNAQPVAVLRAAIVHDGEMMDVNVLGVRPGS